MEGVVLKLLLIYLQVKLLRLAYSQRTNRGDGVIAFLVCMITRRGFSDRLFGQPPSKQCSHISVNI